MELVRNFRCGIWVMVLILAFAVLAHRKLDIPGSTRQFIATVNNNCRDFKGVLRRCRVWKDMGFCFKYRRQMQHVCNKTCQYCVPGQKQWHVIDIKGVWGRLREPASAPVLSTPAQPKRPAIQILGKVRAPQVEDAASAIATQLEGGIDNDRASASSNVLGQPNKFHSDNQNTLPPTRTEANTNDETKGKMSTSLPVSPAEQEKKAHHGATISGKTQVSEQSEEKNSVVMLMGYELGENSSEKVHDVLNNAKLFLATDSEAKGNVGPQHKLIYDKLLALRKNGTSYAEAALERKSPSRIPTEDNVPESDLKEIAELLDSAASVSRRFPKTGNQYMHEETNEGNADTNALQLNMGGLNLETQEVNTLQSNVTHNDGIKIADSASPISSDDTTNQNAFEQITAHSQPESPGINSTSMVMVDNTVKLSHSEGMPTDVMVAGNKHGNINNPILQTHKLFRKPSVSDSSGKQVTLTINEKPGTGEAVFKVQNSPYTTGVSYTTEEHPGGLPPPSYLLQNENEEARAKSEEEEAKIRAATSAIKNVIKLFDRGSHHSHTRLVQEATKDFPADSKSLETSRELTGIDQNEYNAEVAQAQNLDRARVSAQALSQQHRPDFSSSEMGPDSPPPNYAVVSVSDSKDWKSLAHVLATQLKRVLNHMEDREKESRYEKEKIQEEMMLMAQQQTMGMGREDDEGPDDYDDEDDDEMNNREKRRHSVSSPHEREQSRNASQNRRLNDKKSYKAKSNRKLTGLRLAHRAVKKLSRLEMLHKPRKEKRRLAI